MLGVTERRVKNDAKVIGLRKQTSEMPSAEMGKVWAINKYCLGHARV